MSEWFRAEAWTREESTLAGFPVCLTTYRLRARWVCKIDNVSPGAIIARAVGTTRDEAVSLASAKAEARLRTTRRHA